MVSRSYINFAISNASMVIWLLCLGLAIFYGQTNQCYTSFRHDSYQALYSIRHSQDEQSHEIHCVLFLDFHRDSILCR